MQLRRVFYRYTRSNDSPTISVTYQKHNKPKEMVCSMYQIEHDVLTPLVFSVTSGMAKELTRSLLKGKNHTLLLLCCLSFSIVHSAIKAGTSPATILQQVNISLRVMSHIRMTFFTTMIVFLRTCNHVKWFFLCCLLKGQEKPWEIGILASLPKY